MKFIKAERVYQITRNYWHIFILLLIIALGIYVRTLDYQYPYLRNIDSYAFTRQIEEIAYNGYLPSHDDLLLPPDGIDRPLSRDLYVFMAAYTFNAIRIFYPSYTLFQFLIWYPAFLASLMAIPAYYIGKILYDRRAGILAAFFIVFDTSILARTLGADPDNDGSVLLFPLIAIMLFLFAYKHINEKGFDKRGILYTIIAGIGMGAWSYVWTGYWFVVWLLAGFLLVKLIFSFISYKNIRSALKEMKIQWILFFSIMAIAFSLSMPILGIGPVQEVIQGPFSFSDIKGEENREFPNVYVSVAELQSGGALKDVIQRTNVYLFGLMIMSLIYLAYSSLTSKKPHFDTFILLLLWFIGPAIATTIGVRFSILFAAPVAIGSAIMISKIFRIIEGEGLRE